MQVQLNYISSLLVTIVVCLSELSIILLIGLLTAGGPIVKVIHYFAILIALWGIAMIFVEAFQCHLPVPWSLSSEGCIDQVSCDLSVRIMSSN